MPDLNIGVVYACNVGGAPSLSLVPAVVLAYLMGKDPLKEIPVFEIEKKMGVLVGEYESYKGIVKVSVVRKGGILFVEVKEKLGAESFPLVPESDKLENFRFYIPMSGTKMPVEFVVDSLGKVDLYIERNRFHKIR